jgi:phosphomannomutase / phosphoglucomutase
VAETGALLGGEFSGHIFFTERWYGHDDGMYAAARLVEILSALDRSLDEALSAFPDPVSTPEIRIPVPERDKFALIGKIAREAVFDGGKINTLDGIRVDFDSGWGLLRASNTSAALTARFEADSEEQLAAIQQAFRDQVGRIAPQLSLPF